MAVRPNWASANPMVGSILAAADARHADVAGALAEKNGQIVLNCPAIFCLGNGTIGIERADALVGTKNLAILVFENAGFTSQELNGLKIFDRVVTGSTWSAGVLEKLGMKNVPVFLQGVDTSIFFPGPRGAAWKNHFVIFSGGKLEYRKGQDIVIAAVKEFRKRHPETVLTFAWHNVFPLTITEIEAGGLVSGIPEVSPTGEINFKGWLNRQGVGNFVDLGSPFNWHMPSILHQVDVALFPSRAEGATNFAAMECLACGIPTILSANTGHLDIISDEICYPLRTQGKARATEFFPNVDGWGESSPGEIVELLEKIYRDREEANKRGRAAVEAMGKLSWENQFAKLLKFLG
jgi:glycosyltransferase involved in cell wall biosynthesis